MEWWVWPIALFAVTFAMGIVAVLAGVGGGVLFVPIVSAVFPFHLDFVRAAGLLLALSGALSAAPALLSVTLATLSPFTSWPTPVVNSLPVKVKVVPYGFVWLLAVMSSPLALTVRPVLALW